MSASMPRVSPDGHSIIVVPGNPEAITQRGTDIATLATDMNNSSTLLRNLVDNGAEMRGDAINKLKELAEKVYSDLDKGGDLYSAVAPHIKKYGAELKDSQTAMRTIIEDLVDLWEEYERKASAVESARADGPTYPTGENAGDDTARDEAKDAHDEAVGDAEALASGARGAWDARAKDYDTEWDSWYTAFTDAANGINDDTAGKIEDSWNDDFGGFLKFMSDVLAVAGMILAVLALVIGGPLVMILAGIVAVLTLVVAITRVARGEGSWVDVAFGVIGVIPFIGPAAKALSLFRAAPAGASLVTKLTAAAGGSWAVTLKPLAGTGFTAKFGDFSARLFTGKTADEMLNLTNGTATGLQTLDMVGTILASKFAMAGAIKDTAGGAWEGTFNPSQFDLRPAWMRN